MENKVKINVVVEVGCGEMVEIPLEFSPSTLLDKDKLDKEIDGLMYSLQYSVVNAIIGLGKCQHKEKQVMDKLGVCNDKAKEILAIINREDTNEAERGQQ